MFTGLLWGGDAAGFDKLAIICAPSANVANVVDPVPKDWWWQNCADVATGGTPGQISSTGRTSDAGIEAQQVQDSSSAVSEDCLPPRPSTGVDNGQKRAPVSIRHWSAIFSWACRESKACAITEPMSSSCTGRQTPKVPRGRFVDALLHSLNTSSMDVSAIDTCSGNFSKRLGSKMRASPPQKPPSTERLRPGRIFIFRNFSFCLCCWSRGG
mmetsp:Transcript_121512/g.350809  ORF Transcript_121512/g.350809 Transcript_121512/m.350809 type:complete len:212 (-) Transcript_121512:2829-3464(-)